MEISHIDAMTLIGSGLLIEPVPVAASHAAHNFSLAFCRNHKASCTTLKCRFSEPVPSTRTPGHLHYPSTLPPPNRRIDSRRHGLAVHHRSTSMQDRREESSGTHFLQAFLKTLLPLTLGVALIVTTLHL